MYHIPSFDGLRAIAIIFVLIGHIFPSYLHVAWTGVEIFFILSGYLITGTFLSHQNIIYFYKRRILRILPALFLFLSTFLIISNILNISYSHHYFFSAIFFYSNWVLALGLQPLNYLTHLWSLALEEQFYLFFPWLLLFLNRFPKLLILIFLVCISYKFHMFQVEWSFDRLYYGTDTRLSSFLLGAILYFIHTGKVTVNLKFKIAYINIISILALLSLFWVSFHPISKQALVWAFLSNIWIAILMLFSKNKHLIVNNVLSNRMLCWVGQLSFGLYLWHYPIFTYLNGRYSVLFVLAIGLPVTFIIAYLSYNYFEKPLLEKYKRKI